MDITLRIHDGTQRFSDKHLCVSCANGHIVNGDRQYCTIDRRTISSPVYRCTSFEDQYLPNEWDFAQVAWIITTDKKSGKVGFRPPKKDD